MSFISEDVISSSDPVKSYSMEVTWNCISVALAVGVTDFFLDTLKHFLIHPVWALVMEADQIVEHCHLVRSKGGQHVVAVMHWVFVGVFVVDSVSMAPLGAVWWDAVPLLKLAQRSGLVGRGDYIIKSPKLRHA